VTAGEVRLPPIPWTRIAPAPLPARFLERPNRFTAVVELPGGDRVRAHLPNPGRLTGTLAPGCEVLLDGPYPPPRALPYTVVAAREGRTLVCTVTTYANRLFPVLLDLGLFPELPRGEFAAEVLHGRSRFDFRAGGTLVEVKSVTLRRRGGWGLFPDAVTARGARHVRELAELASRGHKAAIVFMAQRGDVGRIAPAREIDPAFAAALAEAAGAGVTLLGCAVRMRRLGAVSARRIPVSLDCE